MIRHRHGSYYYRYWHRRQLHERGGFPSKRAALEAEWTHRKGTGATATGTSHAPATVTLAQAVLAYQAAMVSHHAPQTRTHVEAALARFTKHAKPATLVHTLTADHVAAFKAWRATHLSVRHPDTRVKGATVNRDLTYVSAFFTWCTQPPRHWLTANPARGTLVTRLAEPQVTRVVLDDTGRADLWARLEAGFPKFAHHARYRRERVKAELLFHLGVRRGVVLGLTWEQVDWAHRWLTYHSKGKDRTIPLSQRAIALLRELHTEAGAPTGGRVFPERSTTTFRRVWQHVRAAMGHPTLRVHDLRVAFARTLASKGVDLITIKELGGWSSLAMVERYVPPYMQQAKAAVELLGSKGDA
jgi:integrase